MGLGAATVINLLPPLRRRKGGWVGGCVVGGWVCVFMRESVCVCAQGCGEGGFAY